jgi:tRNA pseudouridine38-40 synthase
MVRNIVGTLIEAGKGNIEDVTVLPAAGGPTAPAKGLFLVSVEYGPGVSTFSSSVRTTW